MKKIVIGISGLAGSGKDTFFSLLSKRIPVKRYALADELKLGIRDELINDYNIDILSCSRAEKEIVRPRLVEYAKKVRFESEGRHWVNLLEKKILPIKENICITDIRYDDYEHDEIYWLQQELKGVLVHVSQYQLVNDVKIFQSPPNEEEARNNPKIKRKANYVIEWPKIESYTSEKELEAQLSNYADDFLRWLENYAKTK